MTSIYSDISRLSMMSFFTLFDAVAVQTIKGVHGGTNARTSASHPNVGLKSLLLTYIHTYIIHTYIHHTYIHTYTHIYTFIYKKIENVLWSCQNDLQTNKIRQAIKYVATIVIEKSGRLI